MNWAHIHLMINHAPVVGALFCTALLLVALWRRTGDLQKLALWAVVATALVALPVYFSGEPAEHQINGMPGIAHDDIEDHEEFAGLALTAMEILGAAALFGAIAYRRSERLPGWLVGGVFAGSLAVATLMGLTANLGGKIHHPEIGAPAASSGDDDRGSEGRGRGGSERRERD